MHQRTVEISDEKKQVVASAPPALNPSFSYVPQYTYPSPFQPTYPTNLDQRSYDPISREPSFYVPRELADDFKTGKVELKKVGLEHQKAQICVLLDVSRSMQNPNKFFLDSQGKNKVQDALNRILALSFSLDDNRQIEIIPFGPKEYDIITIDRSNYKDATNLVLKSIKRDSNEVEDGPGLLLNLKEGTNYAAAIRALRKKYFGEVGVRQKIQPSKSLPVFAIMITDGNHNDEEEEAENQFKFASFNNVFIKSFGLMGDKFTEEQAKDTFEFLTNMDDAKSSLTRQSIKKAPLGFFSLCCGGSDTDEPEYKFCIDNNDFVPVIDPSKILMSQVINEFRGWLEEAHKKGILQIKPVIGVNYNDEGRKQVMKIR